MPDTKNRLTAAPRETTDADREGHPGAATDGRRAVRGLTANSAMDIYASALYLPLMGAVPVVAPQEGADLSYYRVDRTYGPGCAANDAGANDNLRALPPVSYDSTLWASAAESPWPLSRAAGLPIAVIKAAGACLRGAWSYIRRERAIARAISLLASLDDRTLHDIGIHRSEIARIARYGFDDSGRVRSRGS